MTSLQRFLSFIVLFLGCALAQAAPQPDPTFGNNGSVRIGVPAGYEDTAYASAIQADGKILVAGTSLGRRTYAFVTRFRNDGTPDPGFGANGTVLTPPPPGYFWTTPIQVTPQADGSLFVVGILYNGFVLTRIAPGGALDTTFASGGMLVVTDEDAFKGRSSDGSIRLAVQPDGKLLVVTDASANGVFALRFRRFMQNGAIDTSFGSGGERLLGNLPADFSFTSANLAVSEPGGGFTLAALSTFSGGTYLLLRLTANGTLDTTFGSVGYRSGFDLGNPFDTPSNLARTTNGGYALFGRGRNAAGVNSTSDALWEVDASGTPVPGFGSGGRILVANEFDAPRALAPLPDGGLATVQSSGGASVRISRFDTNGNASAFGSNGSTTIAVTGYQGYAPVGLHADANGRLTVYGWANARFVVSGIQNLAKGLDVVLVGLTSTGAMRTDFGRGDGIAVWNNPALSNDRIDAIRFDHTGRIVLAGYSDGSGISDYLLSRLTPDGALDPTYGIGGRLNPQQVARFIGIARAVQQPDDATVVASGEAFGSFGSVRAVTIFRANANGSVDASFKPNLLPAGPNAALALGVRPDGRLVYGTNDPYAVPNTPGFYVLQQFLPDGSPDLTFGTSGRVSFPADVADNSVNADLVVLADGSVVFLVCSSQSIRLYKVAASGAPVASFGTGGQLIYPLSGLTRGFSVGPTILALADGTLLAAQAANPSPTTGQRSLFVLRASANGQVISASNLKPDDGFLSWVLTPLPDASVVIARNRDDQVTRTTALYRLLPDGQFDAAFGAGDAYSVTGMTSISALAVDSDARLLVSGQDATSAVLARFRLNAAVAGVGIVEYFNVNLGHYFMTANPAEMNSIETGGAGPGWQRTGFGFAAYVPQVGVPVGALPVCRFYGTPGIGPNSHFYTVDPAECTAVKRDRGWTYEGIAFYAFAPINGRCGAGSAPVYRAYNNRFAQNDSNHRYATDRALLDALGPQGWTVEGVVLCVVQ